MRQKPGKSTQSKEHENPTVAVVETFLRYARLMRKNSPPDQAKVAADYELQFQKDLEKLGKAA
jgi:hypothetical protein